MSCCGPGANYDEIDEVSRFVVGKIAAFLATLRDNGFAVGLYEGQDAASLMTTGYAARFGVQTSVFGTQIRLGQIRRAVRCVLARQAPKVALDDDGFGEGRQQPVAEEPAE